MLVGNISICSVIRRIKDRESKYRRRRPSFIPTLVHSVPVLKEPVHPVPFVFSPLSVAGSRRQQSKLPGPGPTGPAPSGFLLQEVGLEDAHPDLSAPAVHSDSCPPRTCSGRSHPPKNP